MVNVSVYDYKIFSSWNAIILYKTICISLKWMWFQYIKQDHLALLPVDRGHKVSLGVFFYFKIKINEVVFHFLNGRKIQPIPV